MNNIKYFLKYIILFFFCFICFAECRNKIKIKVENSNKRYIIKKMSEKLIINLKSYFKKSTNVEIVISNLIDDYSDMPIYKKKFKIYPGMNYIIINLDEVGIDKFSLRIYHSNKLIDYRIIEVLPEKGK